MFEGKGAHLSVNKYVQYEKMFVGGYFIIASNDLPLIADPISARYSDSWLPMTTRFTKVDLTVTHPIGTPFPYNAKHFACALLYLLEGEGGDEIDLRSIHFDGSN